MGELTSADIQKALHRIRRDAWREHVGRQTLVMHPEQIRALEDLNAIAMHPRGRTMEEIYEEMELWES
jgi:hypothetical protein